MVFKIFIPGLRSKDVLQIILSYVFHKDEFHKHAMWARSLCKASVQIMQFPLTRKAIRTLVITNHLPSFDITYSFYKFHLVVVEGFLLKIPAFLELESLTIVGSQHMKQLDPETLKLLATEANSRITKQANHFLHNCKQLFLDSPSPYTLMVIQSFGLKPVQSLHFRNFLGNGLLF